jgi:acetolactate synthase small subunit
VSPIETASRHTISILVDNEPGILARVVGLFSGRGYNIESLTVAKTNEKENLSRITIVTAGTPMIIEQIKAQLDRLVPVHRVRDLTVEGAHVERELALVKVKGTGEKRVEALPMFSREELGDHALKLDDADKIFMAVTRPFRRCVWGAGTAKKEKWTAQANWWYFRTPIRSNAQLEDELATVR